MFGDEGGDVVTRWGALAVVALGYVAIGAWDWTDTVEALARYVDHTCKMTKEPLYVHHNNLERYTCRRHQLGGNFAEERGCAIGI